MNDFLSILLIGGAFVAAAVLLLTTEQKIIKRLTMIAGITAFVGGLLFYGYGYYVTSESPVQAVLHTAFAVCRMFIGEADYEDIRETPLLALPLAVTIYWCIHVLAFFATSSAAISLLGANTMKKMRVRFSTKKNLNIIYGIDSDSMNFGSALSADSRECVVYIPEDTDSDLPDIFRESGYLALSDSAAINGDEKLLKGLGVRKGNRKVTLYALSKDRQKNIVYATALLSSFEKRGVKASQISLLIHAREENAVNDLQVTQERFGYGVVRAFQAADLTARLLIRKYPPHQCVTFDAAGAATEDFEVLIIGFGKLGQTVLRNVLMNAQFEGSAFRADVFTKKLRERGGFFNRYYESLLDHYRIVFHDHDGHSQELYDHLEQRLDRLKYVVLCAGPDKVNGDIEDELCAFFRKRGKQILIHQCSYTGIKTTDTKTGKMTAQNIYQPDVLATRHLDTMAMLVNQQYMGAQSKGVYRDWRECDYFSRMSSRAFADSVDAVLHAAGKTQQQACDNQWEFTPEHLENLCRMEHARWNAFHFCMGYRPMSDKEYADRARIYQEQVKESGKGSIRIGKNPERKTHACMIPWEALDALAEKESALTGKHVDYKGNDKSNIMLIPQLLRIKAEGIGEEEKDI